MSESEARRSLLIFAVGLLLLLYLGREHVSPGVLILGAYGYLTVSYMLLKLLLSVGYREMRRGVPRLTVAVVIPFFNEDPQVFERCVESVLQQHPAPDEVYVIDDGSADWTCYLLAQRLAEEYPNLHASRLQQNRGKRRAQEGAFRSTKCDVIVTMDSDTILSPGALAEGLKPFHKRNVMGVCGNVRVLNCGQNLLTRLIGVRYSNAFECERAAYSVVDSVLCATGVFTLWRAEVIKDNLDDYLNQSFLGVQVGYGDDRRLTNYALMKGRVVYQSSAVAWTLAPSRLRHFLRQQVRWNKSFFRETLYALRHLPVTRAVWWLAFFEITLWLGFTTALLVTILVRPVLAGAWVGYYYLGNLVVISYMRSARHSRTDTLGFLMSPLYGLLHICLLTPIRLFSLCTLRDGRWGTRSEGVEVMLSTGHDSYADGPSRRSALAAETQA